MTPQQEVLARKAIEDLRTINLISSGPHDEMSLREVLNHGGIQSGFIDYAGGSATGYSREGLAALANLAKTYRPDGSRRAKQVSNASLAQLIASTIVNIWREREGDTPDAADISELNTAVEQWFESLTQVRLHAIPCIISPYHALGFDIGPVHFCRWRDFPTEKFSVSREEFWHPEADGEGKTTNGGIHFGSLLRMAEERYAGWVALVEIAGRAEKDSKATADIAVDIALGALQLAAPGLDIHHITRATAAVPALWRADVWTNGDQPRQSISNHEPAKAIAPELFSHVISDQIRGSLNTMGNRLEAYLSATSSVPLLDEAWCNAVYWFHEAIAETLDTVAVVKLEIAIEVLFRSADMNGSKSRIKASFAAFFQLVGGDQFVDSGLTVDQFILNITTARSRVAHGTWPTIHTDLPGYKKQQPVSRAQVEDVARLLLIQVAIGIEQYVSAGQTADDTESLFNWVKSQRHQSRAVS